jgi:predicted RNase H-like nuclease (RuvC/YqgF family)
MQNKARNLIENIIINNHMNEIAIVEKPLFLMESNYLQFEEIDQKIAQIEEENKQMRARMQEQDNRMKMQDDRMKMQDELINELIMKQMDARILKKEIKLLKDNLVNQSELIEEIKNLKESIKKKKDRISEESLFS